MKAAYYFNRSTLRAMARQLASDRQAFYRDLGYLHNATHVSVAARAALRTLDGSLFTDALRLKAETDWTTRRREERLEASVWCRFQISRYPTKLP